MQVAADFRVPIRGLSTVPQEEQPGRFRALLTAVLWFAAVSCLPMLAALASGQMMTSAAWWSALAHAAALGVWGACLRHSGLHAVWTSVAVFGLASVFSTTGLWLQDSSMLGEAVFLYLLLSLLSAHEKQPNLQAIASAALLISAGVLTKPPIAISCVIVSFTFFLIHRRRSQSGSLGFAMLMFTPAVLCISAGVLLALVTGGNLSASAVMHGGPISQQVGLLSNDRAAAVPMPVAGGLSIVWLIFPATVAVYRLFISRSAASDIAFWLMLLGTTLLSSFPGIPQPLNGTDLFYLAAGGGAALFAQSPPKGHLARLVICASLLVAAYHPYW